MAEYLCMVAYIVLFSCVPGYRGVPTRSCASGLVDDRSLSVKSMLIMVGWVLDFLVKNTLVPIQDG